MTDTKVHQLTLDPHSDRMCIGDYELHCGDCFRLHYPPECRPAIPYSNSRIEYNSDGWIVLDHDGRWIPASTRMLVSRYPN